MFMKKMEILKHLIMKGLRFLSKIKNGTFFVNATKTAKPFGKRT